MKRVRRLIVLIFIVTLLLGANTMGVFHYRDGVLASETRKDSMFNLSIKYSTLINQMRNQLNLYFLTGDDRYQTQFYIMVNDYKKGNNVALGYHSFTENQMTEQRQAVDSNQAFNLKEQVEYLNFKPGEEKLYRAFLKDYTKIFTDLQRALKEENPQLLDSEEFALRYDQQHKDMVALMGRYINRMNEEEDRRLAGQETLELTMLMSTILLIGMAILCFMCMDRENRENAYLLQRYTTIVENINVGICILGEDDRFEYTNPEYRTIMDLYRDPVGFRPRDLIGESAEAAVNIPSSGVRERESGTTKIIINGVEKHMKYSHFTIQDGNGCRKYLDLVSDITDTEKMQDKMREQLKEIHYYSGVKDSFIANMSHEIKTPINAILGMSHFLKNTELTARQKDLVGKIESSSDVLLSIINDVLDISKLKSQKLVLHPKAFNLMAAVRSIRDMFQAQMQEKNLEWKENITVDPDLCLYLDQTRLLQVLVNLIGNACKFTERGMIGLSIHKISEDEEQIYLRFRVEDTGVGIDMADAGKLFQEFEQLENHLNKQHTGTGLGLAICKHIVQAMGGNIWVKSELGEGSRFYFTLQAPKAQPEEAVEVSTPLCSDVRPDGRGGRVLVVEDTEINAEVAENLLKDVGITCDMAMDGLEAVSICRTHERDYYHLILMDIHMPRMNGYEASTVLKQELGIETPILALTATSLDDKVVEQYVGIIDGFILKPIKVEAFYAALCNYFPVAEPGTDLTGPNCGEDDEELWEETKDDGGNDGDGDGPFAGMREALHNMGGIEPIYRKHVDKFKINYAESRAQIEAELKAGQYEEARRLAHSVKGLAATLGMPRLQQAAKDLEMKIAEGAYSAASSALDPYQEALDAVISTPLPL